MAWSDAARAAAAAARRVKFKVDPHTGRKVALTVGGNFKQMASLQRQIMRKGEHQVTIGYGTKQMQTTRDVHAAFLKHARGVMAKLRKPGDPLRRVGTHLLATYAQQGGTSRAAAYVRRGGISRVTKSAMAARGRMYPSSALYGRPKK